MNARRRLRLSLGFVLVFALAPLLVSAPQTPAKSKTQFYKGKVIALADWLQKEKAVLDKDARPFWMALQTEDGKVYPLLKDAGSRMFFTDKRLLNRPMRLTARPVGNGQFLQVFQVHSYNKGQLQEVYYWCGICVIKRFEKNDCECCGYPMVLKEVAVKD